MTRTQVITDLITKYDKVVTGQDKSAIELAVFKIAICQLVDAAFSGGGGGGGTTIGTVSDGIDGSIDINTIIARLTAIEANTAGGGGGGGTTVATVSNGIDASVDIDTIITSLASINTNQLTEAGVASAIQSAADIDTIISRLTTIVTNTTPAIVTAYAHTTVGVVDTGVTVLAANANRKAVTIINRSATDSVDLFFGSLGGFGAGLPLAFGQVYEINSINIYRGVITARSSTGISVSLAVAEGT